MIGNCSGGDGPVGVSFGSLAVGYDAPRTRGGEGVKRPRPSITRSGRFDWLARLMAVGLPEIPSLKPRPSVNMTGSYDRAQGMCSGQEGQPRTHVPRQVGRFVPRQGMEHAHQDPGRGATHQWRKVCPIASGEILTLTITGSQLPTLRQRGPGVWTGGRGAPFRLVGHADPAGRQATCLYSGEG